MYYFRLLKQGLNKDDLIYAQFQENVWSHIFQKNPLISNLSHITFSCYSSFKLIKIP
jgi:hypothetical protein